MHKNCRFSHILFECFYFPYITDVLTDGLMLNICGKFSKSLIQKYLWIQAKLTGYTHFKKRLFYLSGSHGLNDDIYYNNKHLAYMGVGLCDSYSVVSSCGLRDSDSQGPSKGGPGESWCPAAPGPACWTDISLQQEDLSFCVTGIFFMGFLSLAMWSHLLTPALRHFCVVSPSGQGLVPSATDLNLQKTIISGQRVILCACYWREDLRRAAFRITLRLF